MHMISPHPRTPGQGVPLGPFVLSATDLPIRVEVLAAAGNRCQCTGTDHTPKGKRCRATGDRHPLVVASTDPAVPEALAARLPASELSAWCRPCRATKEAQAAAQRLSEANAGQIDLFGSQLSDSSGIVSPVTATKGN